MRKSTRKRLFLDSEYRILWCANTEAGPITLLTVGGTVAIVHEYPREEDGFEVYKKIPGNLITQVRDALGLTPKEIDND